MQINASSEKIRRIQWSASGDSITIYSNMGMSHLLRGADREAFEGMLVLCLRAAEEAKEKAKNAANQEQVQEGSIGEHQEGDAGGPSAEAGSSNRDVGAEESGREEAGPMSRCTRCLLEIDAEEMTRNDLLCDECGDRHETYPQASTQHPPDTEHEYTR